MTEQELEAEAMSVLGAALRKLKAGMDRGPFGPPVVLEPNEATILFRVIELKTNLTRGLR